MRVEVKNKSSHALGRLGPKRLSNRIVKLNIRINRIESMLIPLRELNVLTEPLVNSLFLAYKSLKYEENKAAYFLERRVVNGNSASTKKLKEPELLKAFFNNKQVHEHYLTKHFFDKKRRFITK